MSVFRACDIGGCHKVQQMHVLSAFYYSWYNHKAKKNKKAELLMEVEVK